MEGENKYDDEGNLVAREYGDGAGSCIPGSVGNAGNLRGIRREDVKDTWEI